MRSEPAPWDALVRDVPVDGTAVRILDAAMVRFGTDGVARTSMSQIAADAGISRVWLYRFYENRDAVVRALLGREAHRFLTDLVAALDLTAPATDAVTAGFEYAVVTLRNHDLLRRLVAEEPEIAAPLLTAGIGPLFDLSRGIVASYLERQAGMTAAESRAIAETLLRLIVSIVLNNETDIDFDNTRALRAYMSHVIPRLVP